MSRFVILEFFIENAGLDEFEGKRVLEVGSRFVNGSVRPFIEKHLKPREYIGCDIEAGKFVDVILSADKLVDHFGAESFDAVISTETLEHIADWRSAINNMKTVLAPDGLLFITTVRRGFHCHGYPYDFWRYELEDMRKIFSDFNITELANEIDWGISLKAKKPTTWSPKHLDGISLYSILKGGRTPSAPDLSEVPFSRRITLRLLNSQYKWILPVFLVAALEKRFSGALIEELIQVVSQAMGWEPTLA